MTLKVAVAGLGYFSQFHLSAWAADARTTLVAVCDPDIERQKTVALETQAQGFADAVDMMAQTTPDVVDIVAPPPAHAALIRSCLAKGRLIICQKPFCTSIAEAQAVIADAKAAGARIVIHENFRFQPWYRQIKAMLDDKTLGDVFQARFALRPGDGRGKRAYLDRQPAFQTMERLLIYETGVHLIDTFRWLFGDITNIYADLRQLNPVLKGEDAGLLSMTHASGVRSIFDGNRLTDHAADNLRMTMGEMEIVTEGGTISLSGRGEIFLRAFGSSEPRLVNTGMLQYPTTFGGGCVAYLIEHVINHLTIGSPLENEASDYLHVMQVCEAAYQSNDQERRITL